MVTDYRVSGVVSFTARIEDEEFPAEEPGVFVTYATLDPAGHTSLEAACRWIETNYVQGQYQGRVITDFDEMSPRLRLENATFGLPRLIVGDLQFAKVQEILRDLHNHPGPQIIQNYIGSYQQINTMGGPYVGRDVHTGGGDFIGRDQMHRPGEPVA